MLTARYRFINVYADKMLFDVSSVIWACYEKGVLNARTSTDGYMLSNTLDRPYGLQYLSNMISPDKPDISPEIFMNLFTGICADCNANRLSAYVAHVRSDGQDKLGMYIVADYFYRKGLDYGLLNKPRTVSIYLPTFHQLVSTARKCYYQGRTMTREMFMNKIREATATLLCECTDSNDIAALNAFLGFCADIVRCKKFKMRGYPDEEQLP